jgi:rubrerythrin
MMFKEDYMTTGENVTGVRDEHYNRVSILYHALQGAETYNMYIRDAEAAGDQELAQFFRQVQAEERQRAARAKELLGRRLTQR